MQLVLTNHHILIARVADLDLHKSTVFFRMRVKGWIRIRIQNSKVLDLEPQNRALEGRERSQWRP